MDMRQDAMPSAAARMGLRFEGRGGEYFNIWILNLALSVITLGIFSAWAKVRSRRYFYGNMLLNGHGFDYHASPPRILIGRAIVLAVLLGYGAMTEFLPDATLLWLAGGAILLPWMIASGLRFTARNTSHRNLRFDFTGRYGGALWAFLFWPFLAAIGIGVPLYPLGHRARLEYQINNLRFGGRAFLTDISAGRMFTIYLAAIPEYLMLAFLFNAGISVAAPHLRTALNLLPDLVIYYILFSLPFVAALVLVYPVVKTVAFNMAINETSMEGGYRFDSTLTPWCIAWVAAGNLALTLATLGLFYPWAKVSVARYHAERLAVSGPADMDGFMSDLVAGQGAIGEEIASFFDIDIGL